DASRLEGINWIDKLRLAVPGAVSFLTFGVSAFAILSRRASEGGASAGVDRVVDARPSLARRARMHTTFTHREHPRPSVLTAPRRAPASSNGEQAIACSHASRGPASLPSRRPLRADVANRHDRKE